MRLQIGQKIGLFIGLTVSNQEFQLRFFCRQNLQLLLMAFVEIRQLQAHCFRTQSLQKSGQAKSISGGKVEIDAQPLQPVRLDFFPEL
ncbi:hypothetical protein D3C81_2198310 [compost metagenome]